MKDIKTYVVRKGYDKKKCVVHARAAFAPDLAIATAQYLDVSGSDVFDGLMMSKSYDLGKSWSEFEKIPSLSPEYKNGLTEVVCDATPLYHKKTGKILLTGHTASYKEGGKEPVPSIRSTPYAVYDEKTGSFGEKRFVEVPDELVGFASGCSQCCELSDGDLLIPVYGKVSLDDPFSAVSVMRCSFDGERLRYKEHGKMLRFECVRGLGEPSVTLWHDKFYLTLRNDEAAFAATGDDGINFNCLHLWRWDDGSILQSYNTQQHFLKINGELYLVYTRRDSSNGHVFRHRAPLYCAKVQPDCTLLRDSEFIVVKERGARLGNFGCTELSDGTGVVMAAEWMQPPHCEDYGSDNSVFAVFIREK